jgi:pimeloyl-ACP methyl ester carboxylesterase
MTNLIYIHGANSTPNAFNFIRQNVEELEDVETHLFEYDSNDRFIDNLYDMKLIVGGLDDVFFVSHSLGGLFALYLANEYPEQVLGAVTLSTPYGGSAPATTLKYLMPKHQLLKDIDPYGSVIRDAARLKIMHPWLNIVTTKGHSMMMNEPNDGVVTMASMMTNKNMELIKVPSNHYEVLVNYDVVRIIEQRMKICETV